MKSMIIQNGNSDKAEYFICPVRKCRDKKSAKIISIIKNITKKEISKFYTYIHAADNGWIFTTDRNYSKDGKVVALCPECASKYERGKENH